jgi:hypothetical protein
MPATVASEVEKQKAEMLKNGLIEESQSPWASPMIIVKQKTREGKIKLARENSNRFIPITSYGSNNRCFRRCSGFISR